MRNTKSKKVGARMANDDLPSNLDPTKLRFVGFGLGALHKHAAGKRKMVELEPDVAKEFASAEQVNNALRLVKRLREIGKPKHRKTA
jgi:hypothetical protein